MSLMLRNPIGLWRWSLLLTLLQQWSPITLFMGHIHTVPLLFVDAIKENMDGGTPEELFRAAAAQWQSPAAQRANDWSAWHTLSDQLWKRFHSNDDNNNKNRLELVGAMEEGILAIERTIFGGQGGSSGATNAKRDAALAVLYTTYAKVLYHLTPTECHTLANDPHTLLIGADTVSKLKPSSDNSRQNHPLCVENAENSLRNAASLDATNTEADQWLQKVLGQDDTSSSSAHQRKPKEFVAELFDSFADTFDDKLLKGLDYKVPALVGQLARNLTTNNNNKHENSPSLYRTVLDAGCGTGLAGRYLQPLMVEDDDDDTSSWLVGVDASQKMLDKAALCTRTRGCGLEEQQDESNSKDIDDDRPLYNRLVQMDLEDMTWKDLVDDDYDTTRPKGFDLIVAADVLVYFGTLDALLQTFGQLSLPHVTRLIFTCELAEPDEAPLGWRLLPSGRFAHTREHALESARKAGFVEMVYQEIVPRQEKGEPVRGHLFGFEYQPESVGASGGSETTTSHHHHQEL